MQDMSKEALEEAVKQAKREYKRRWAKEHPESVRRSQQKYWEKKAKGMQEA